MVILFFELSQTSFIEYSLVYRTIGFILFSVIFFIDYLNSEKKEVLIPLVDAFVDTIDDKAKTLYTNLPEGLLEVYTSTDSNQPDDAD